jgi:8-oxo-dGTP diphosphatase
VSVKSLLRRAAYRLLGRLTPRARRMALRMAAPKVTLGACAVILDTRGRLLVAHPTYRQRPWGLPGGPIGQDEQPREALARELSEELGVPARMGPVLHVENAAPAHQLTLYDHATLLGTPRQDGTEIDALRYAPLEDMAALLGPEADPWLSCLDERQAS